ncbi:MAG: CoA transferase, partial [Burkholderiaceae bacterium]|nr:CoA transferase [Burkholderiaceae bacterium]
EWRAFCDTVLLQPELATDARFNSNAGRNQNRESLKALILRIFGALTAQQVTQRLDEAGIANARVNNVGDVWAHPQLAARHRLQNVQTSAGPVPAFMPPGVNDSFDYRMDAVPSVGQHTDAILRELGLDDSHIAQLHASMAV